MADAKKISCCPGHFAFTLFIASFLLGSGVLLGAVGAHWLSSFTPQNLLDTFKTGVHYQIIHGLGVFLIGVFEFIAYLAPEENKNFLPLKHFKWARNLMLLGIFLFSGHCYVYALTANKFFVIPIPFGGASFIIAWFTLAFSFYSKIKWKDSGRSR
ncbi:MAG: DUF423 domain-containing protein [Bdellovibrio sp.]|nr:DUF423 domain-containing protein [Bdellovibrio sp.]